MSHRLGMSGSTILSDPNKFASLFKENLSHVEIGEFTNVASFHRFVEMAREQNVTFGIHSPLIRGNSKYDLIEEVSMSPEIARADFEKEVADMAGWGAEYILVHFPYFKGKTSLNTEKEIEKVLALLSKWQNKYNIPIVCEPKLGQQKSHWGIEYFHQFTEELWNRYGLSICVDLGDYRIATGDRWREYIEPLLPFTKVVHLHNVTFQQDKYFWIPLHPNFERRSEHYDMKPLIDLLAKGEEKFFVLEHTPHTHPSEEFIDQGIQWVRTLIGHV